MTRLAIVAFAVLLTIPTPRCRVEVWGGKAWLVCPCKRVTYVCEDWWRVPVYRGRRYQNNPDAAITNEDILFLRKPMELSR